MKEQARLSFRAAPHTSGETAVKLKDYVEAESVDAVNTYEAWEILRASQTPLEVGDILESELGGIQICKYIGFDAAKWIIPEVKNPAEGFAPTGATAQADAAAGKL